MTTAGATGASAANRPPAGYETGRLLSRGGSGSVYEARQVSTGRTVALKLLDVQMSGTDVQRRFERERHAMGRLADHPHIVTIIDAGLDEGRPWLAMELCAGGSLADLPRPLGSHEAVSTCHAIASALAAAHAQGVLHCDVKPGNILVSGYGRAALSDFGIARLALESQGSRIGGYTLDHVPPEVLRGDRPGDRGDVWSLGTTLWQLLAGAAPFRRTDDVSASAVMRRIEADPLPPLPRADLPPGFVELLAAMTAKEPAGRPSAADVVRRALDVLRRCGWATEVALPVGSRTTRPAPWVTGDGPPTSGAPAVGAPGPGGGRSRPSSTSTVLGPVATGPTTEPPQQGEAMTRTGGGATTSAAAKDRARADRARRRRRRMLIAGLVVVLVVLVLGAGAYLGSRFLPGREAPTQALPTATGATPTSAAAPGSGVAAAGPASPGSPAPAPAGPSLPRIALTLLCNLKTPTTCAGKGYTQSYRSEVTTPSGDTLYDGCFDYLTVTGPAGVVQQDSFGCNTGNPIYLNQNRTLPDGEYRIDERVETQDGQRTQSSLAFSVRS